MPIGVELKGQVALVTGGSRGIGRAIALALADAGASVAVSYLASEDRAKEVVRAIEALGRPAILCQGDVSDYNAVVALRERATAELGPVAILVNNAGVSADKSFLKMTPAMWRRILAVNLDGVFNCAKVFVGDMVQAGYGRIVNITSVIGQIGHFGQANYAASKSGAMALTKTLAKELAAKGITVNAVAPGFIETDMVAAMPPAVRERILSRIPLREFGRPEEVARAVLFLAAREARYITGQEISINGGLFV
jgi:3-oxoacyl-[acyl-carrier protein] reductase